MYQVVFGLLYYKNIVLGEFTMHGHACGECVSRKFAISVLLKFVNHLVLWSIVVSIKIKKATFPPPNAVFTGLRFHFKCMELFVAYDFYKWRAFIVGKSFLPAAEYWRQWERENRRGRKWVSVTFFIFFSRAHTIFRRFFAWGQFFLYDCLHFSVQFCVN